MKYFSMPSKNAGTPSMTGTCVTVTSNIDPTRNPGVPAAPCTAVGITLVAAVGITLVAAGITAAATVLPPPKSPAALAPQKATPTTAAPAVAPPAIAATDTAAAAALGAAVPFTHSDPKITPPLSHTHPVIFAAPPEDEDPAGHGNTPPSLPQ